MDTIVALSTPLGTSGIGVVRLSGPDCLALAQRIFQMQTIPPRQCLHGRYLTKDQIVLDDPLFTFFPEGASYTREPMLEISCHGNPLILKAVVQDCLRRGCRPAEPGEFTRRAFLNGKLDLCQAEAVEDLIHSRSIQALQIAQKQLQGGLTLLLDQAVHALLEQIAFIEAYLDFPEEDLPVENRQQFQSQMDAMIQQFSKLIDSHQFYAPLHQGIKTVIVGRPNAGKSTIFNALLGQERALVSDIPGTTRDFISETLILGSYTLKWVDTAGLHRTKDPIESMGIDKTYGQIQTADVIIWVIDGSVPWEKDVLPLFPKEKTLVVLNKVDLGLQDTVKEQVKNYAKCIVSMQDANAVEIVKQALQEQLQQRYNNFSQVEFMIHERHAQALQEARLHLKNAQLLLQQSSYDDCLAAELKAALYSLECMVGRVDYERILDEIFSRFCIGK